MTSWTRRRSDRIAFVARFVHAAGTLAPAAVGCGGIAVLDGSEAGTGSGGSDVAGGAKSGATTSSDGGGGAEPLTCDLVEGPVELLPAASNPPECRSGLICDVWFGHGQHMTCPDFTSEVAPFSTCDVRDCLCEIYEVDGFVASFATGEVIDARDPDVTCHYSMSPG